MGYGDDLMNKNDCTKGKLVPRVKFGYAVGQMADSVGYNMFYYFFLFFLTDYAGLSPSVAGTISLIAVIWDAVTDPIVGFASDNLRSKYGRRRPLMLAALIPYGICAFLLFSDVGFTGIAKPIYYGVVAVLFWTFYTIYVIPFFALGAELTEDFNERTSLRSWSSVFLYIAVMIASALPPTVVDKVQAYGYSAIAGWRLMGAISAVMIVATGFICWYNTGSHVQKERVYSSEEKISIKDLIKSYKSVLKLKPVIFLAISVFAWSSVTSLLSSGPVYLMSNNLGYSAEKQSTYFMIMTVMMLAWIPFVNYCANKFDKRNVYALFMLISSVIMAAFYFIGFSAFYLLLIFTVVYALGDCTFWTIYYSLMYDISELDELENNERREGTISALMSLFQKFGSAFSMWFLGIVLQVGGYDGTALVQTEKALKVIMQSNTIIPAIFGIIAGIAALMYPLTKPKYEEIMRKLEEKRKNETAV